MMKDKTPASDELQVHDRLAIRELVHAYFEAADRQDGSVVANLFIPNGELAICANSGTGSSGPIEFTSVLSPPEIGAMIGRQLGSAIYGLHVLASHVIEQSDSGVTGRARALAHRILPRDEAVLNRTLYLRYEDTYTVGASGWRFARRELYVDFTQDVSVL